MSDVEKFWNQIAKAYGDPRSYAQLSPQEQHLLIQSINGILAILNNR